MKEENKIIIWAELGRLFVDMSKLVFAGIILAAIMKQDIPRSLLIICGVIGVTILVIVGILFITLSKSKK